MNIEYRETKDFTEKEIVPPLLNGFLSMHRNVFSALYAAPHKKRTRQQPYDPSGSFDLHLILLYSASARFSGLLLL